MFSPIENRNEISQGNPSPFSMIKTLPNKGNIQLSPAKRNPLLLAQPIMRCGFLWEAEP